MINLAIDAAVGAGTFLYDNFGKITEVISKGDRDFATNLDRQAEMMIVDKIKEKYPNHGILGEENEKKDLDNEWVWVIDPLDGTHNFMHNIDIFGVSIGILRNGDFVSGVIYMPKDKELYVAEKGKGAYKNNKQIKVSDVANLKQCSVSFDSSVRYNPEKLLSALDRVSRNVFNIRMLGSSARLLTYVAEGKLDVAVEFHDKPWDYAAGVCIIQEAGGVFTNLDGGKMSLEDVGYVAANKSVHKKILDLVNKK